MAKKHRYSTCEIINRIVKELIKLGWAALPVRGHPRLKSPDGKITITYSKTPSDHRTAHNWISQLRRCGVDIPT